MKILIVMNDYFNNSNGMCVSTQRFVDEMRSMGHEVRICANARNGMPDYPLRTLYIPIFGGLIEKEGFTFAKRDIAMLKKAIAWSDIVHVEDPFLLCAQAGIMAKIMGKPLTGTFHIYPENISYPIHMGKFKFINMVMMGNFKHLVYNKCDAIMCPTEDVAARLRRYFFKPKLKVISNGIKDTIVDYAADNQNLRNEREPGHKFKIITVGRYAKEKNQILLLKALQYSKHLDEIELIVAGKGPLENKLKKQAAKLSCPVQFGFYTQTDLMDEMLTCDLYIHCADIEIEGMSCLEAFTCGAVPLISSARLSSTKNYAISDANRFEINNPVDLANHIDYWIEHPDLLEKNREDYLDLAQTLRVSNSTKKLIAMMEECL